MTEFNTKTIAGGVTGIVAALAIAVSTIAPWEGKKNDPYLDIVSVPTVCYGETRVPMRRYSDQECKDMLTKATKEFQSAVLRCTPVLEKHPYQLAAATSLSYNIGSTAYCGSTVARKFNQGDFKGACNSFGAWRLAGGKVVQGLVNRRKAETKLCLTNLP